MKKTLLYLISGLLVLVALGAIFNQLKHGLHATGLSDQIPWGAYIANFSFNLGVGAGILFFITLGIFNKQLTPFPGLLLSLLGLIALGISGVFVILDLGVISKFYLIMVSGQFSSPLFWDVIVLNILILISLFYIIIFFKQLKQTVELPKILSIILMITILGLFLLSTEVFAGLKARTLWHTPLLSAQFLISALLAGLAVIYLLSTSMLKDDNDSEQFLNNLGIWIMGLLVLDLILSIILSLRGSGSQTLFPKSGIVLVVIANIIPLVLLFLGRGKQNASALQFYASIIILVGLLGKRLDIIISGYTDRWLLLAPDANYCISSPEIFITLGIYGGAVFLFLLLSSYLSKQ